MSHNFKRPSHILPAARRQEKQIAFLAKTIGCQAALETFLKGAAPLMRAAMLEQLRPLLSFVPADEGVAADCPACGMRRGSVIGHECLGVN